MIVEHSWKRRQGVSASGQAPIVDTNCGHIFKQIARRNPWFSQNLIPVEFEFLQILKPAYNNS